ncbi:MAG: iron ABC transporter permease [Methylotenera sp.]|nr:iron ABC transporter permease [Oligoflexia bacterium]
MNNPGKKTLTAFIFGLAILAVSFYLALRLGSTQELDWELVKQLRLPRALMAVAVGAGLAVSGATLQALFSNPLCEPYTLGISSGSALGAVIGLSMGVTAGYAGLSIPAFLGAGAFAFILYLVSLRAQASGAILLLSGVMLGFLGSSLVSLWMALVDPNGIQAAIFWLLGDLSRARIQGAVLSLSLVTLVSLWIAAHSRKLDALLMGEEAATALGISVQGTRRQMILATSLLIGLCVSGAGMIGFVGLIIPHFVRRHCGALHGKLIPLCAIWGANALLVADTLARCMARPYELPVGVVTALVGAPLFLMILFQGRERAA